jgi:hypothetical protein
MAIEDFGVDRKSLETLLNWVDSGELQLPDFQRGWVWPQSNISSLLASISLGYPTGTLMLLQTGGATNFKARLVEGVLARENMTNAQRLILDGQQRMTSLYQAIRMKSAVRTVDDKKREISGWFYIDMKIAVDPSADRDLAIRFVPENKIIKNFQGETTLDLSSAENEFKNDFFPVHLVFSSADWQKGYIDYAGSRVDSQWELWKVFQEKVLNQFQKYQMPYIELARETPKGAVCEVFEKVNTGGVTLTVFELLTATFAADNHDLRADWKSQKSNWPSSSHKTLRGLSETDFLQIVTLLATYKRRINSTNSGATIRVGCKREDILNISWEEYESAAKDAVKGLVLANEFLLSQYIFDSKFLPYGSQLIPLSAIFAILGNEADTHAAQEKISRWYWSGVLGELYGGAIETRFGLDLPEVVSWVRGSKDIPRTVGDANFASARLLTLNSRLSAAYKGIYALMLRNGALDWIKGTPMTIATYFDSKVDIHHIFPKAWCNSQGIKPREYNSIINKTPISARTNRSIGGISPSKYLAKIIESGKVSSEGSLVTSVESHAVKYALLSDDDYYGFFENRKIQLISMIEKALGKPVQISHSDNDDVYQDSEVEDDED